MKHSSNQVLNVQGLDASMVYQMLVHYSEFACSDTSIIAEISKQYWHSMHQTKPIYLELVWSSACKSGNWSVGFNTWTRCMGISNMHTSFTNTKSSTSGCMERNINRSWMKEELNQKSCFICHSVLRESPGIRGRIGFELPAENQLWNNPHLLDFEKRACLRRVYFHGCALNLKGKQGKFLKKPWCVSTSDLRLIQFFSQHQCDKTHEHEESFGKTAAKPAFYTPEFANTIIEAWYPKQWYKHVPDLSTTSALVTKNLTKAQWKQDAKAIEAIEAEAAGLRANGTWLDESVIPVTQLKKQARASGEDVKIAEVLTLAGIKHSELDEQFHRYKGCIVYRGDQIRNQSDSVVIKNSLQKVYHNHTNDNRSAQFDLMVWTFDNSILCRLCAGISSMSFRWKYLGDFTLWIVATRVEMEKWTDRKIGRKTGKIKIRSSSKW